MSALLHEPTLLYGVALVVVGYFAREVILRARSDVRRLPGPPTDTAHWFWGHEKRAREEGLYQCYMKWTATFGSIFKMKAAMFHHDIVIVTDNAAAQHVFQDCDMFVKATQFRLMVEKIVGESVVTLEHERHRRQRRLLAPAFSGEAIRSYTGDILQCVETVESNLTSQVLSQGGNAEVNIAHILSNFALDIIGRVGFAYDFQAGASPEAQTIRATWDVQLEAATGFGMFVAEVVTRAFPSLLRLPLPGLKEALRMRAVVNAMGAQLLRSGSVGAKGRDLISLLIRTGVRGGAADTLSERELINTISVLIMAGHETTAASMNFTFLALARHPDVQHKLREEVRGLAGGLTYDSVQQLPYLDAVVKEGLRVYPGSPVTERVPVEDTVLPLAKPVRTADGELLSSIKVRAGQVIRIPFVTMNNNPDVWGADAGEFRPERWIAPGGVPPPAELPHGWSGILTFCDGPRNCIGYRLAILEMKMIVAALVRTFEFADTGKAITEHYGPTLIARADGKIANLPVRISLAS